MSLSRQLFTEHLAHPQTGVGLEALGGAHYVSAIRQDALDRPHVLPEGPRRHRDDGQVGASEGHDGVGSDAQMRGEGDARDEPGVLSVVPKTSGLLLGTRPQADVQPPAGQEDGQGRPPAGGPRYADPGQPTPLRWSELAGPTSPDWPSFRSSPANSRLMLSL